MEWSGACHSAPPKRGPPPRASNSSVSLREQIPRKRNNRSELNRQEEWDGHAPAPRQMAVGLIRGRGLKVAELWFARQAIPAVDGWRKGRVPTGQRPQPYRRWCGDG